RADIGGLGYEASFENEAAVYTIDLLPQTHFKTTIGGHLGVSADLSLEGTAKLPEAARLLVESTQFLSANASLKLSTDMGLVGRLSLSVISPVIQAVGKGSPQCQWH